jgi:hypothetical protein
MEEIEGARRGAGHLGAATLRRITVPAFCVFGEDGAHGWYRRWGNSTRQFSRIDSYVHERLALFDSKKHQKSGRRWGRVHTNAWLQSLGVYHLHGTIRYG